MQTALDLAAQAGTVKLVSEMAQADALVLDGVIPPGAAARAQAGAGVVLILGAGVTSEQASALLGQPVTLTAAEDAVSLAGANGVSEALLTEIIWNGAPQVRERQVLNGLDVGAQTLVSVFESGEGVLHNIAGADIRPHRGHLGQSKSSTPGMGLLQLLDLPPGGRAQQARRRSPFAGFPPPAAARQRTQCVVCVWPPSCCSSSSSLSLSAVTACDTLRRWTRSSRTRPSF